MRTINQWLEEYNQSHQNSTNKLIHWICVPAIALSILGFAALFKLPFGGFNAMHLIIALALVYYFFLSPMLALGMLVVMIGGMYLVNALLILSAAVGVEAWVTFAAIFVIAWIGQFIGHKIEGKKPSFFKDVQFLMIGPLWLMSFIYKKAGLSY